MVSIPHVSPPSSYRPGFAVKVDQRPSHVRRSRFKSGAAFTLTFFRGPLRITKQTNKNIEKEAIIKISITVPNSSFDNSIVLLWFVFCFLCKYEREIINCVIISGSFFHVFHFRFQQFFSRKKKQTNPTLKKLLIFLFFSPKNMENFLFIHLFLWFYGNAKKYFFSFFGKKSLWEWECFCVGET